MAIYINGSAVAYGTSQTGGVEQVAALASTGATDHLYYLTVADATHEVGLYYWNGTAWISTGSGSGSGTGTSNYTELTNKPKINGIELVGNKNLVQLDIAQQSTTYTKLQVDNLISVAQKVYVTSIIPTGANNVGLYYVGDGTSAYNIYLVDTAKSVTNLGSAAISLDGYQKETDVNLETGMKTVVGGINELKNRLDNLPSGGTITLNGIINGSPTFYAPVESGVYGQILISQGYGNAPAWSSISSGGTSVTLNGSGTVAPAINIYAPIESGNVGQVLSSQGPGLNPKWIDSGGSTASTVVLNGISYANNTASFYAPTTNSTTAGQCIISQASGLPPTWGNKSYVTASSTGSATNKVNYLTIDGTEWKVGGTSVTASTTGSSTTEAKYLTVDGTEYKLAGGGATITLNGEETTAAEFYAPTDSGTTGQTLVSKGANVAPEWKSNLRVVSLTKAEYNALSTAEKYDINVMYAITDEGASNLFDTIYPVGSVYMTVNSTKPDSFPGSWTKMSTSTSDYTMWKRLS